MLCQTCNSNPATVHVTEIVHPDPGEATGEGAAASIREQHLCETCAQAAKLPQVPECSRRACRRSGSCCRPPSAAAQGAGVACPECGMTLLEFRQRGRLGCPKDYEVFAPHLRELLRAHPRGHQHVGRAPGPRRRGPAAHCSAAAQLQRDLEAAIREEAYEQAARLRDELKQLEQQP